MSKENINVAYIPSDSLIANFLPVCRLHICSQVARIIFFLPQTVIFWGPNLLLILLELNLYLAAY